MRHNDPVRKDVTFIPGGEFMLVFKEAQADQAGLISHLFASSWRKAYRGIIAQHYLDRLPDDYWVPSLRSWLGSGQMYGVLAYLDGKPVGCCIYGRGRDAAYADWGEIVSLYLLPDSTRKGIGSALLLEALRLLAEDGYHRCYLWAIDNNVPADCFYRKHGFRRSDDTVSYKIGGENVTDVRYVLQ